MIAVEGSGGGCGRWEFETGRALSVVDVWESGRLPERASAPL